LYKTCIALASDVVESESVIDDGWGIVIGSWSLKVQPLEIATAVGTWHQVP